MDAKFNFNKTEKFDFGKVGKRMPYSTPDDFFKDMEANILNAVKDDIPQPVRIEPKAFVDKGDVGGCIGSGSICGCTPGTQYRFYSQSYRSTFFYTE